MSDLLPNTCVDAGETPPPLPPEESSTLPPQPASVAKWRWLVHLLIIGSYPLLIAGWPYILEFFGYSIDRENSEPGLSSDIGVLMKVLAYAMGSFFILFGLAWTLTRVNADQLMLRWKRGWLPWVLGFGYSVAMRLFLGVLVLAVITAVAFSVLASRGTPINKQTIEDVSTEFFEDFQPDVEHMVDTDALVTSPVYLLMNITLVSFVMAGFREELWRSSMLAAFKGLFPNSYEKLWCRIGFVLIIAVIFGIGHWPQGLSGVILTGTLGVMLGFIMIFHRSIWQATLAHGFFDASSFVLMYFLFKYKDQFESLQKVFGAE